MSIEYAVSGTPSDTLDAVSGTQHNDPARRGYGALWQGVPRELLFLVLTMPIAYIGFAVLVALFSAGAGTLVVYVGVFVVLAALYTARGFGKVELVRLRWAGMPKIEEPDWNPGGKPVTFLRATFGPYANGHYWLYLLHGMVIAPIISMISWVITIVWVAAGLGGLTYWFWDRFIPYGHQDVFLSKVIYEAVSGQPAPFDPRTGDNLLEFVVGAILIVTLPFITRGLTRMHQGVARGVLAAWPSEALQREVADLSASRGAAVVAEDQSLRRLERDLHDGPQQRLIRLQMDLATAERKLETDPEAARTILAEAGQQAQDTLEELRALSRGFAPPILQDRGLGAALDSLAARSTVPITLESTLPADRRLPSEIERSAYFIAAELVTNVARHSGATAASLYASLRDETDGTSWLDLWVTDNGTGGAALVAGHGSAGSMNACAAFVASSSSTARWAVRRGSACTFRSDPPLSERRPAVPYSGLPEGPWALRR